MLHAKAKWMNVNVFSGHFCKLRDELDEIKLHTVLNRHNAYMSEPTSNFKLNLLVTKHLVVPGLRHLLSYPEQKLKYFQGNLNLHSCSIMID